MPPASDLVTLRGGTVVAAGALELLWSLESRGFALSVDAAGGLLVRPGARLTAVDRRQVRAHRDALAELVTFVEELVN